MNVVHKSAFVLALSLALISTLGCQLRPDGGYSKVSAVGEIPPELASTLGGPQVVFVRRVMIPDGIVLALKRQAAQKGLPEGEVEALMPELLEHVSRRVYTLATGDRAFTVCDDPDVAKSTAQLTFDVVVRKLDIFGTSEQSTGDYVGKLTGGNRSNNAVFDAEVEIAAIARGIQIAAESGGGRKNHQLTGGNSLKVVSGVTEAGAPNGVPSEGSREVTADMLLSPVKDALDNAVETAWGAMWRKYVETHAPKDGAQ